MPGADAAAAIRTFNVPLNRLYRMSSTLLGFVIAYLVLSIGIGVYAATRVHNASDYITAGRSLPMFIVIAMVFATWFGAETVLGIPATFLDENLGGTISDPFGASLCLVLFGLVFARPLYRMGLLTLGDFYRRRFNRPVEAAMSFAIAGLKTPITIEDPDCVSKSFPTFWDFWDRIQ